MVPFPRTPLRSAAVDPGDARLRPLNAPKPLPRGRALPIARVLDTWLIEDEWWRAPVARRYIRAELTDGRVVTLFKDLLSGDWFLQSYNQEAA